MDSAHIAKDASFNDFGYSCHIITRSQKREGHRSFSFLELPAELRCVIYDFCIDLSAACRIIDRYYHKLNRELARDPNLRIKDIDLPLICTKCPNIFVLSKQIYAEAKFHLRKCDLAFNHGLLDLKDITHLVPPCLFQSIGSITIDDSGHPLLQANMLATSWLGYIALIQQLAGILAAGHRLQTLAIAFTSDELVPHITTCWNAGYTCGFRDSLRRACRALLSVHHVGQVTLTGFPSPLSELLKARMEGPALSLLDLPREVRDMIYSMAADWSDISVRLIHMMASWADKSQPPPYPVRSTPTILLLNRHITTEALTILRKKPLFITCPGDHDMTHKAQVSNVLQFITSACLRHIQHLVITLESWEWIFSLDDVLSAFSVNSRPASNLQTLALRFCDPLKSRILADSKQYYPDSTLDRHLRPLKDIRNLAKVSFTGDLPACYTVPLAQIMQMRANAVYLPKLHAQKGDGSVVDVDDDVGDTDDDEI